MEARVDLSGSASDYAAVSRAALLLHQGLVFDAVRLVGERSQPALPVCLIILIVPLKPDYLRISFKGQNVRGDPVEEPAVVADDNCAAGKGQERIFERTERVDIQVIGRFIQQQKVSAAFQHFCQVNPVAFSAGKILDAFLLVGALEIEGRGIGACRHFALAQIQWNPGRR